jgi:hypothetical protein
VDAWELITPPAKTLVSLDEAKVHLRVDGTAEDADITKKLATAQRSVEKEARRVFLTQTWLFKRDNGFYDNEGNGPVIEFSKSPLQAVNYVKYLGLNEFLDPFYDTAYDDTTKLHTLSPTIYQVKTAGETGLISPTTNNIWPYVKLPILAPVFDTVQIELVAGYGDDPEDVPDNFHSAALLMLGHLYENRSSVITGLRAAAVEVPQGVSDLIWPDRVVRFA